MKKSTLLRSIISEVGEFTIAEPKARSSFRYFKVFKSSSNILKQILNFTEQVISLTSSSSFSSAGLRASLPALLPLLVHALALLASAFAAAALALGSVKVYQ